LILDRDSKFDATVITFLKATGLKPKRASIQSSWQNGTAEGWVGSCRREILDHVIALDERHLLRLMRDYVNYYQDDRIHDSPSKDTPNGRPTEQKPSSKARFRLRAWADCIIGISGKRQHKRMLLPNRHETAG